MSNVIVLLIYASPLTIAMRAHVKSPRATLLYYVSVFFLYAKRDAVTPHEIWGDYIIVRRVNNILALSEPICIRFA